MVPGLRREVLRPQPRTRIALPVLLGVMVVTVVSSVVMFNEAPVRQRSDEELLRQMRSEIPDCSGKAMDAYWAMSPTEQRRIAKHLPGPIPPPPRPRLADTGGVSQRELADAVNGTRDRLAGCMREWSERSRGTAATIVAGFHVLPDGSLDNISTAGLDDRIVPQCITAALEDIHVSATDRVTAAQLELKYVNGQIRYATNRLGTEPR